MKSDVTPSMLKSTHKAAPPLPPDWTEHKAPTGHSYFYNAVTKQSTYTRPTAPTQPAQGSNDKPLANDTPQPDYVATTTNLVPKLQTSSFHSDSRQHAAGQRFPGKSQDRRQPEDRPKKKQVIPGCEPWILVHTKLKRRFVYNPELGESFWKFPPEVMKAVVEMDREDRERRERRARGELSDTEKESAVTKNQRESESAISVAKEADFDSDEYEEVEVTDDEVNEDGPSKRLKTEEEKPQGPIEFNEEDIAYQLAAMGHDDDYGDVAEDWEEGYDEPELNAEDAKALFMDLLDDFHINPYTPWETVVEEGKIIGDDRYTCLPSMKSRRETWDVWSRDRIQRLRENREKEEKKDPKIGYMAFLEKNATPKLYWPEFRRKYNKDSAMRDSKLKDKDREKWYRDYINRLKLSENKQKEDLMDLLKSVPISALNRSTSLSALPPAILTDLRYISVRSKIRDPLIEGYISMQPHPPEPTKLSAEDEERVAKQKQERERREQALADRERRVREEQKKQRGKIAYSRGVLRDEEEELERAMKVGREGLLTHMKEDIENKKDTPGGG